MAGCGDIRDFSSGNHRDSAPFFQPAYKFIAVIAFIRQNELACRLNQKVPTVPAPRRYHYGSLWRARSLMDSQVHPLPHGLLWSSLPCSVRFLHDIPLFCPTGVLVNLDRSAVLHQRCFVHQILLNQGCEDIFPYSGFCPGMKPTVYARKVLKQA